jgi:NAD(P)H-quinone oxidoreductase subunit 5
MFVQCGLGWPVPAAVAHLVWHGMFKAYLFLASGGAAKEKRSTRPIRPTALAFVAALVSAGWSAVQLRRFRWWGIAV